MTVTFQRYPQQPSPTDQRREEGRVQLKGEHFKRTEYLDGSFKVEKLFDVTDAAESYVHLEVWKEFALPARSNWRQAGRAELRSVPERKQPTSGNVKDLPLSMIQLLAGVDSFPTAISSAAGPLWKGVRPKEVIRVQKEVKIGEKTALVERNVLARSDEEVTGSEPLLSERLIELREDQSFNLTNGAKPQVKTEIIVREKPWTETIANKATEPQFDGQLLQQSTTIESQTILNDHNLVIELAEFAELAVSEAVLEAQPIKSRHGEVISLSEKFVHSLPMRSDTSLKLDEEINLSSHLISLPKLVESGHVLMEQSLTESLEYDPDLYLSSDELISLGVRETELTHDGRAENVVDLLGEQLFTLNEPVNSLKNSETLNLNSLQVEERFNQESVGSVLEEKREVQEVGIAFFGDHTTTQVEQENVLSIEADEEEAVIKSPAVTEIIARADTDGFFISLPNTEDQFSRELLRKMESDPNIVSKNQEATLRIEEAQVTSLSTRSERLEPQQRKPKDLGALFRSKMLEKGLLPARVLGRSSDN